MRRREFITLLGGAAAAWPLGARAQQPERTRRIGMLMNVAADDPEVPARIAAFAQGLQETGWMVGRNVRIDYRWGAGDSVRYRKYAEELASLGPDVLVGYGSATAAALKASGTKPVVFLSSIDPVGAGLVMSLARPGTNTTGFTAFEYGTSGKWLEIAREMVPGVKRIAVLRDPTTSSGIGQFAAIQSSAFSVGVELSAISLHDAKEMADGVAAFAGDGNRAIIVTASGNALVHRKLIILLAVRHRMPAVFADRVFVADGGLVAYGPDRIEQFRRAADYVNRILRGEKAADLPVQTPTKYELVINLKTANALDLTVPSTLLARADEVIE
jgi:putative tryptophan/tyrosine transport system substrate-binding protein